MPHCVPPHSRKASCKSLIKACAETPSMVTMFAPPTCATGTRQLFTSIPSNSTAHEPHSPSPQPSFAPVKSSLFRSTSSNLSMGCASTFTAWPLTVKRISHFAINSGEGFMSSLAPKEKNLPQMTRSAELQTNLPAAAESNENKHQSHLPRRLQSRERVRPSATLRCLWHRARHECCQAPQ